MLEIWIVGLLVTFIATPVAIASYISALHAPPAVHPAPAPHPFPSRPHHTYVPTPAPRSASHRHRHYHRTAA